MFREDYRREMEAIFPTEEEMKRLMAAMEEERPMKKRVFRTVLLAAALCAALTVTALAASPTLREALTAALGSFGPYSQAVEGLSVTDQGIEVRVVSALSDGNTIAIYFEARDLEGDRLDGNTHTNMQIQWPTGQVEWSQGMLIPSEQVSYDPETGTALYVGKFIGDGLPARDPVVSLYGQVFSPDHHSFDQPLPEEVISRGTLKTEVLPTGEEVLAPMQNSVPLVDDLLSLSSCGFGTDGAFHLQLRLERGSAYAHLTLQSKAYLEGDRAAYDRTLRYRTTEEVEFERDGVTYIDFTTGATVEDAEDIAIRQLMADVDGEEDIRGQWRLEVPLESQPTTAVDLTQSGTGPAFGTRATQMYLSPISCTIESAPEKGKGSMGYPLALFLEDGTVLAGVACDSGYYSEGYATNHWTFPQPIGTEKVTAVAVGLWYIPIEGGRAQSGHWLSELPRTNR